MSVRKVRTALLELIKQEKSQLKKINTYLDKQEPDINNSKYLRLLSKASFHRNQLDKYHDHLKNYSKRKLVREAIVNMNSKVKLVSTKIGATIWVDATNYVDLVGKKIGDVVLMHNSTFEIAGIY